MSDKSRVRLGKRIRKLRKANGYQSQQAFATALGLSWITVNRYERGLYAVPLDRLDEIAALLGTNAEQLVDGTDGKRAKGAAAGLSDGQRELERA